MPDAYILAVGQVIAYIVTAQAAPQGAALIFSTETRLVPTSPTYATCNRLLVGR